jgi:hypothetical protein
MKETLKQAGLTFISKKGNEYILQDENGKKEVWFHNPNHASSGIVDTINGKKVDLEFARSFKESMNNIEKTLFILEGQTKKKMESKVEKMCTCDGGASLDYSDHKKSCPAYKMLKDDDFGSDEIDQAEYQYGADR